MAASVAASREVATPVATAREVATARDGEAATAQAPGPGVTIEPGLVECDFDALAIGQAVRLTWSASEGGPPVPTFTLA